MTRLEPTRSPAIDNATHAVMCHPLGTSTSSNRVQTENFNEAMECQFNHLKYNNLNLVAGITGLVCG